MTNQYNIVTKEFEGPFELLLELIEKQKLSVNEISLSKIANEYLSYAQKLKEIKAEETANFLVVAATLMLIKSRSLLPGLKLTEEEEESIEDLEKRLALYKQIKDKAKHINARFGKQILFSAPPFVRAQEQAVFIEPIEATKQTLFNALKIIIAKLPSKEILPKKAVEKVISLEEKIKELVKRVEQRIEFGFNELTKGKIEKVEIIINFLAILELAKRGLIFVKQEQNFSDIKISNQLLFNSN